MKTQGLPKTSLLRKNREFNRVYRAGHRLRGERFAVIYLRGEQLENRLGISVQRKVGNAVRRNRVKRIIREVFRQNRQLFPLNADVIIAVRPGFSAQNTADFYTMISAVLC